MREFFIKHKRKFLYSGVGVAVFYTLFGFFGVPLIIEKLVPKILQERANFSVEKAKFNPFTYELNVTKPRLDTYKPLFSADKIDLKLDIAEIFKKTLAVEILNLKSPLIHVEREQNGTFNFDSFLSKGPKNDDNESSSINVTLDNFKIENGSASYIDNSLNRPFHLVSNDLNYEINGLNLKENTIGKHDLKATSGSYESLSFNGRIDLSPFRLRGDVRIKRLALSPILRSYLDMETLKITDGYLNADIKYVLSFDKNLKFDIENSNLKLEEIKITQDVNTIYLSALKIPQITLKLDVKDETNLAISLPQININSANYDMNETKISTGFELGEARNFTFDLLKNAGKISFKTAVDDVTLDGSKFANPLISLLSTTTNIKGNFANFALENNQTSFESGFSTFDIASTDITLAKSDKIAVGATKLENFKYKISPSKNGALLGLASAQNSTIANKNGVFSGFSEASASNVSFDLQTLALNIAKIAVSAPFFNTEINEQGAKEINDLAIINHAKSANKSAPKPKDTNASKSAQSFKMHIGEASVNGAKAKISESFVAKNSVHEVLNADANVQNFSLNFKEPFTLKTSLKSNEISASADGSIAISPLNINLNFTTQAPDLGVFNKYLLPFVNGTMSGSSEISGTLKFADNLSINAKNSGKNINFTSEKDKIFSLVSYNVGAINFTPNTLNIANITLNSPSANIIIDKNKKINVASITKSNPQKTATKSSTKPAQKSNFKFSIKDINVAGGALYFTDESPGALFAPFKTSITKLEASVSEISDTRPAVIKASSLVGKSGLMSTNASLYPMNFKQKSEISLSLKDIALADVSPYTAKFIGKKIAGGKLNTKLNYKISNGKLSATNDLNMDHFELGEDVVSKDALNLPIGLAVSVMKDSDDQINVSLPISGSLNDPKFSFGGVIFGAVTKLFSDIMLSPFRFLGKIAGVDTSKLNGIDFELASAEMLVSENEKIENLAKIAKAKPEIKLSLTPAYNEKLDTKAYKIASLENKLTLMSNKDGISHDAAIAKLKAKFHISESGDAGFEKLVAAQKFTASRLEKLANERAQAVQKELIKLGVKSEQIIIKKPTNVEAKQDTYIGVGLGIEK